jgi:hypothetical protein
MFTRRSALACAVGIATLALVVLTPQPATASPAGAASSISGTFSTSSRPTMRMAPGHTSAVSPAIAARLGLPRVGPNDEVLTSEISTFVDFNSGKCLGVLGGNMTDGAPVVQWTCNGNPDQTWYWQSSFDGNYLTQIRNSQDPSKCLGVLGASSANGASLVIWTCNTSTDQRWGLFNTVYAGTGVIYWWNVLATRNDGVNEVMGVLAGSTADGAQVVIRTLIGHPDQYWSW